MMEYRRYDAHEDVIDERLPAPSVSQPCHVPTRVAYGLTYLSGNSNNITNELRTFVNIGGYIR